MEETHTLIPIIYLLLHREADKRRRRKKRGKRLKMRTKLWPSLSNPINRGSNRQRGKQKRERGCIYKSNKRKNSGMLMIN